MPGRRKKSTSRIGLSEPFTVKLVLITIAVLFLGVVLLIPLIAVFIQALANGWEAVIEALANPDALSALKLTLLAAFVSVIMNLTFGIAAAWCISKYEFRGKSFLISLIDLPLAVSPVVVGLTLILLYGINGYWGAYFDAFGIKIIFAVPAIILATVFVTSSLIARELIPLMQEQGSEQEEAALTMGASGLQTFLKITLPNIKWGLLYGIILCNARAMGEFGAVSVVSGHIRGETNTLPLHVEVLYNEYEFAAAFAVASLLACLAILTLIVKSLVEIYYADELKSK